MMQLTSSASAYLEDIFPFNQLVEEYRDDRPLLVDVGGGTGTVIERFRNNHSHLSGGGLVLQDLPSVVEKALVGPAVTVMAHDFFGPQPVKGSNPLLPTAEDGLKFWLMSTGARAYYLRAILHDWPDAKALEILKNVASAMEPDYSMILIHEIVFSPQSPDPQATAIDMTMMAMLSSRERTEPMWNDLITSAGLEVVKIWRTSGSINSIIEARLA